MGNRLWFFKDFSQDIFKLFLRFKAYDGPRYVVVLLPRRTGLEIRPGTLVKIRMWVGTEEKLLPFHRCSSRLDIWPKIRS